MLAQLSICRAAAAVQRGGVIAYPTEGVYGLGCAPSCKQAVLRIKWLKHRPARLGLILVAADPAQLRGYARIPPGKAGARVRASWPGPVSWVLPAGPTAPTWIKGPDGGVAARISAHPLVQMLCRQAGPLVSTSANPHGMPPALDSVGARAYFRRLDYVLSGPLGGIGGPTGLLDARTGAVLRPPPAPAPPPR